MGRIDRINEQVKREVSQILHFDLGDPRFEFVTITGADVSPDLRNAKIYFSVLGPQKSVDAAQAGLNNARGMIRKLLASRMTVRHVPDLTFSYDKAVETSDRIEQTLKEIHDEQKDHSGA